MDFTKYYFFVVERIIKNELHPKKYYSFLVSNMKKKLLEIVKTYQQNLYAVEYCVILYLFKDKLVNNFVS